MYLGPIRCGTESYEFLTEGFTSLQIPARAPAFMAEVMISGWVQSGARIALLAVSTPLLGHYLYRIYFRRQAPGDRFFLPVERYHSVVGFHLV